MTSAPRAQARSWSLPKGRVSHRVHLEDPDEEYFVYVPTRAGVAAPLFVTVHGISRNAHEHAKLFADHCERYGVVLVAPHFTSKYAGYQRLGRGSKRADLALNSILEEVGELTGASTAGIRLFGFSGGAQFAHRYTMAYPQRVVALGLAAAGWYTFPDSRRRFPYGIRPSRKLPGMHFDPEEFLRVPIAVFVGEQDDSRANLRHTERTNREQGTTRVERARRWVDAMKQAADAYQLESRVSHRVVVATDHSFEGFMKRSALGDRVFEALFGSPSAHGGNDAHGDANHRG